MKIVFYKLPDEPENIVVGTDPESFMDSEVALLFDDQDLRLPHRYRVLCEEGVVSAKVTDNKEDFRFFVEDHNNFSCVLAHDSVENAILCGKLIHRSLIEHEETYYDRLED